MMSRTGRRPEGGARPVWRIVNTPKPRLLYTVGRGDRESGLVDEAPVAVLSGGIPDAAILRAGVTLYEALAQLSALGGFRGYLLRTRLF